MQSLFFLGMWKFEHTYSWYVMDDFGYPIYITSNHIQQMEIFK